MGREREGGSKETETETERGGQQKLTANGWPLSGTSYLELWVVNHTQYL